MFNLFHHAMFLFWGIFTYPTLPETPKNANKEIYDGNLLNYNSISYYKIKPVLLKYTGEKLATINSATYTCDKLCKRLRRFFNINIF